MTTPLDNGSSTTEPIAATTQSSLTVEQQNVTETAAALQNLFDTRSETPTHPPKNKTKKVTILDPARFEETLSTAATGADTDNKDLFSSQSPDEEERLKDKKPFDEIDSSKPGKYPILMIMY